MTLSELKAKDVVNTVDGRCIGKPMDLEFDPVDGRVTALVVPGEFSLIQLLRGEKCGIVIPWGNICKIGDDVILVDLTGILYGAATSAGPGTPPGRRHTPAPAALFLPARRRLCARSARSCAFAGRCDAGLHPPGETHASPPPRHPGYR